MESLDENIRRVNNKLQQLLNQYQTVQKNNEHLIQKLQSLQVVNEEQTKQIALLEQQVLALKIVEVNMKDSDKKELKKKLDIYIKEMDKCIRLLSES